MAKRFLAVALACILAVPFFYFTASATGTWVRYNTVPPRLTALRGGAEGDAAANNPAITLT